MIITTKVVSSNPAQAGCARYNIMLITFVSDLRQVGGFLQFPPPKKKLPPRYSRNIVESDVKRHKSKANPLFGGIVSRSGETRLYYIISDTDLVDVKTYSETITHKFLKDVIYHIKLYRIKYNLF